MPFAQRNDPIEALPPQGSDQPLAERISLRAMHRRGYHFKSKPRQRSVQLCRKDRIVVVDDEAILVIRGNGFAQAKTSVDRIYFAGIT